MTIAHSVIEDIAGFPVAPQVKGAGVLVASYYDGVDYIIASSSDNETWTTRLNLGENSPNGPVIWSGAAFFFVSPDGANSKLWSSADGVSWSVAYSSTTETTIIGACGGFLFIERSGVAYRTVDGVSLTAMSFAYSSGTGTTQIPDAVAYDSSAGAFAAAINDGGGYLFSSAAGASFVEEHYDEFADYDALVYFPAGDEFVLRDGSSWFTTPDLSSLTAVPVQDSKTFPPCGADIAVIGEYVLMWESNTECGGHVYALRAAGTELEPVGTPDPEDGNFVNYSYSYSSIGPSINDDEFLFGNDSSLGLVTFGELVASYFWTNFIGQREEE